MSDRRSEPFEILLVGGDPNDDQPIRDAFENLTIDIRVTALDDTTVGLDELERRRTDETTPFPALVLLDIDQPSVDGHGLLEAIKADPVLVRLPVIVLTAADDPATVLESYELAANASLPKPSDPAEFDSLAETVASFWFEQVLLPPIETS
ncbi:response regulator [Natrialba asiatica]|uniref:Response regulator receiver protein n=1 Tax=Natrialba asiatica (strain ATCC 700177 / DSM 12278 / JCM 9576 / FERM P-10747 / NBRC 102637 / 172P1) TaxID=29540 RepID=M0APV8_NATA1|nr:response regulator [Natrialba asiatica]ELZ00367.1 response regulator receiver protein [Natrialba asiatica DSM 12278]